MFHPPSRNRRRLTPHKETAAFRRSISGQSRLSASPASFSIASRCQSELGLSQAGIQKRILYTSTDGVDGASPVIVSGAFFAPKGTPPAGGWPIVAWAHGTVGMADIVRRLGPAARTATSNI